MYDRGHYVTIIYPLLPYYFGEKNLNLKERYWQLRGLLSNLIRGNKIDWFPLKANLIRVPWISDFFFPKNDIVVATAWPTAYSVYKLHKSKGMKFYFIQHHEIWKGPIQKIENSYRLPLFQIVIASWLKRLTEDKYNNKNAVTINNGVSFKSFYNDYKNFNKIPCLLIMYHQLEWKGLKDAFEAIELVRSKHPNIKLVMFGTKKGKDIPNYVEFHLKPTLIELRELYSSCDIFISASWVEGCQLPPMEAMACKCAVVASNVGGIPDYAVAGKTALVFEPKDVQTMAQLIIKLIENPNELKRISYAGYNHIKNFTWEKATNKLEAIFGSQSEHPTDENFKEQLQNRTDKAIDASH